MMTQARAAISPILTNGSTGTNGRQQEVDEWTGDTKTEAEDAKSSKERSL